MTLTLAPLLLPHLLREASASLCRPLRKVSANGCALSIFVPSIPLDDSYLLYFYCSLGGVLISSGGSWSKGGALLISAFAVY